MRHLSCLLCILIPGGLFVGGLLAAAEPPAPAKRPNILVIMSDEHHAGIMGCAGNPYIRTPNLDAIAARGVRFDAHYCSSPICTPARQSFVLGKYVSHHNVWGNTAGAPDSWPSLPRVMNAAGYQSYLIGKMHFKGGATYGYDGLQAGKEKYAGDQRPDPAPKARTRPRPGVFVDNGLALNGEFDRAGEVEDLMGFIDVDRRQAAVKFLTERAAGERPFFLTVGLIAPHYPLTAPKELIDRYTGVVPQPMLPPGYLDTLPLNYKHLRNARKLEAVSDDLARRAITGYYARLEWMDQQVGEILKALRESPFAEDTVVIYTTDHGENLGEHGLWWKNCMYDCAARVPLLVSWPRRWAGGQSRAGACSVVDLVQTIAAVGGAKPPEDWDGRSLLSYLDDGASPWRDLAVCEYYSEYIASGISMIRAGSWKYVYHTAADATHPAQRELYDLRADPGELVNLAGDPQHAARITAMHAQLVAEVGEDPEQTEQRYRRGAIPTSPQGVGAP